MKAQTLIQSKAPLQLQERDDLIPDNGEVVVNLKASALNRRDYWITQGLYPGVEPPVVLGSDGAGTVKTVGADVDESWLNQEVIINPGFDWGDDQAVQADEFSILGSPRDGTFATEVAVPANQLFKKPESFSWHEAAALPLAGVTAYRALFSQGSLKSGETVLITGIGGGVALFALQYAAVAGAKVWVTSSSSSKIEKAIELGATGGFNYKNDGWSKELGKVAGPINLTLDSAGGEGYGDLVNLAAPAGRIVNYGATTGPPEKLDMFKVFWKQLSLRGTTMGSPQDFSDMLNFVSANNIKPVVEKVFPLSEANLAIGLMQTSPQFGKYVLEIE